MLSQLQEAAHIASTLISVCFSFCILVQAVLFKSAERIPRLIGCSFFAVFSAGLFSIASYDNQISCILTGYADVLLLLLFAAVLITRSNILVVLLTLSVSAALPTFAYTSVSFRNFLCTPSISPACIIILSVTLMYLLKNKKGADSLIFWAVIPLAGSALAGLYLGSGVFVFAVPLLKLVSYIILLNYFYRSFLKDLLNKYEISARKLNEIDRSIDLEVKKRMLEVERVNKKLVDISKTDALSNVLNKAAILEAIGSLISDNPKKDLSILMFDIDNFKGVNDTFGHVVGDKCIKMLATTAKSNFRDFDLVGRYGGDEFIVILPETGAKQAVAIAERFRKRVDETSSPNFTVSIGIASYPSDGRDVKSLIEEADKSLYISKEKGRNAVSHRDAY